MTSRPNLTRNPITAVNEMERRVLEEERNSPRYVRYRFLRGFRLSLGGRGSSRREAR